MSADYRNTYYWLLLCLVTAALCLPFLFTTYTPLVDFPNHLARTHILYHYNDTPAYQMLYERLLEPIPNLASDLVILALLPFVGILTAGKIFLVCIVLLFVAGCHLLGRAIHKRPTWLAPICACFVYNSMLLYGFVNYVFGVSLFCTALAYWLEWREKPTPLRALSVTALVFCAYLAHLSAYCFLGATIAVVTLWNYRTGKDTLRAGVRGFVPLVPPLLALVAFMRGSGQAGDVVWNTVSGKLIGMLSPVLSYNYNLDVTLLIGLAAIIVMLLYRARRVQVVPPLFIAGLILILLYIVSPKGLITTSAADARFVLPAVLLVVLSLKIDLPARTAKILLFACLLIASVRIGSIWKVWSQLDERIAAEVGRQTVLPIGARVYPIYVMPADGRQGKTERAFMHVIHYATINRRAFVPTLFALKGQQPLNFLTPPLYATPTSSEPERWLEHLVNYDYVWSYSADDELKRLLRSRCVMVSEANGFSLWRVTNREPGEELNIIVKR